MKPTVRERIEASLRGERPDRIPFTVYASHSPADASAIPLLKKRGMGLVKRIGVYSQTFPNCKFRTASYEEKGKTLTRTEIETPCGKLHSIREPAATTTWTHKHLFSDTDDFAALAFYLNDAVITPAYDQAFRLLDTIDDNTILRGAFGLEPLQHLISGGIFGTMNFCYQWMENRDEVLKLYDIMVEKRRQAYPIVAQAPVGHANYGGNVVPEIVGLDAFQRYYVPNYQEAAEVMHKHNKKVGVHFDANCRLFADDIAKLDLDYVEAFTPAPDTDMTMAEARQAWPGKVLWINYPSSVHLRSEAEIEEITIELCQATGDGAGFLIGITEDVPLEREVGNYHAILNGIERYA